MFTGLVQSLGKVVRRVNSGEGARLSIAAELANQPAVGDSIAVNGCCLTLVSESGAQLEFDVGPETLRRTSLGRLDSGQWVNIEQSLRAGERIGGHFVTGHIDATATIAERTDNQQWSDVWFQVPTWCTRLMAPKGSVAVDGVSLTLVEVHSERFSVMLIPFTLSATTLGQRMVGDEVNIETDILAKYIQSQLIATGAVDPAW